MSAVEWHLNGTKLDIKKCRGVLVSLRQSAPSQMSFNIASAFDSAPAYPYGTLMTLERVTPLGSVIIFQGRVDPVNHIADPRNETHDFFVSDSWQELEDTIYQEKWPVGMIVGGVYFPRAVLGMDDQGNRISTGKQIKAVIDFAALMGVNIQAGVIEDGYEIWPEEVQDLSCAEVIRKSLKFTPDFIPWINHSTSPPTFNVSKTATMPPIEVKIDGTGKVRRLNYRRRDDIIPASVRIIYETAQNIDGEIYRDGVVDKYPAGGPDGGPKCLLAKIDLAGVNMQFQKSPVQVRKIPDSQATAKDWFRAKFPQLADATDAELNVTKWETKLLKDPEQEEHDKTTINPNAKRLHVDDASDLPNELVRGNIADWMRKKVGKIHIEFEVKPTDSSSEDTKKALANLPKGLTIVATNAVTKIYHGLSQWEAGENVPTGIAKAVYDSMASAYAHDGSILISEEECGGVSYFGSTVAITATEDDQLDGMRALVHSVDLDIASGQTTIGFGAAPHLTPADWLELQRALRNRTATWWSKKERTSNKHGVDDKPGSKGDTVSPYDIPETILDVSPGGNGDGCPFGEIISWTEGEGESAEVKRGIRGGVIYCGDKNFNIDHQVVNPDASGEWLVYLTVSVVANMDDNHEIITPGIKTGTKPSGSWGKITASSGTDYPDNTEPEVPAGTGSINIPLGTLKVDSGNINFSPTACGNIHLDQCGGVLTHTRG